MTPQGGLEGRQRRVHTPHDESSNLSPATIEPDRREAFTCVVCWEDRHENVTLTEAPLEFNNRSVEVIHKWYCPKCGREVTFGL